MAKDVLEQQLQKYFGYLTFRPGQKEIIQDILNGEDVLGILPTGSGKSICYQLPAMITEGLTIVVSPLISLMVDQVRQLRAMHLKRVTTLNSFMDQRQRKKVFENLPYYKILYISPELLTQPATLQYLKGVKVSLFVIDEAHCISQWGHEFRPDYLKLRDVINYLGKPNTLALSATVTPEVQKDIKLSLNKPGMKERIYPMDKPNIILSVEKAANEEVKINRIRKALEVYNAPALIYFSSKAAAEKTASILSKMLPSRQIAFYHGGMEQKDRLSIQQQFMNNQLDVICCTSAFGMGINKNNIRLIIHYHLPMQKESYIQEIGRAGRDGKRSLSILLYSENDIHIPHHLIKQELPEEGDVVRVFQYLSSLSKQNEPIPNDLQMEQRFGLHEVQWRFLRFQLEKHGMIKGNYFIFQDDQWKRAQQSILDFIHERNDWKLKKLREMLEWVNSQNCLRESLYSHFQSSYTIPDGPCCSQCGVDFKELQLEERKKAIISYKNWDKQLKYLLQIGEDYETE